MTTWTMVVEIEWQDPVDDDPLDYVRPFLERLRQHLGEGAHYHIIRLPRPLGGEKKGD